MHQHPNPLTAGTRPDTQLCEQHCQTQKIRLLHTFPRDLWTTSHIQTDRLIRLFYSHPEWQTGFNYPAWVSSRRLHHAHRLQLAPARRDTLPLTGPGSGPFYTESHNNYWIPVVHQKVQHGRDLNWEQLTIFCLSLTVSQRRSKSTKAQIWLRDSRPDNWNIRR